MPQTLSRIIVHVVFSTKQRRPVIPDPSRLHRYLASGIDGQGGTAIACGGTADHVHLLFRIPADRPLADLMREIKSTSSRWLNQGTRNLAPFRWQGGYSAFSVGVDDVDRVHAYIESQDEHHRRKTFRDELVELLRRHAIEYDDRYLWG